MSQVIFFLLVRSAFLIFLSPGCVALGQHHVEQKRPLYGVLAYDVTRSTRELPALTDADMDAIVSLVEQRGGSVAFLLIEEKVSSILQLDLLPVAGRLDERARLSQKNQATIRDWKTRVGAKARQPRNALRTDFNGSIVQVASFFNIPNIPANAEKFVLLVSDGTHTAKSNRRAATHLPQNVQVFVVGMDPGVARKLFGEHFFSFGSIAAAIERLAQSSIDARGNEHAS